MAQPILQISKLNAWYGPSHVLQDVSLQVGEGEIVCLIGRNGAGKTTTLKSVMGLLDRPRRLGRVQGRGDPEGAGACPLRAADWPMCRRNAASCRV